MRVKLWAVAFLMGMSIMLYSQDCNYTGNFDINYYKVNLQGHREVVEEVFFNSLLCEGHGSGDSLFLYANLEVHDLEWIDPDATTPQGIRFFMFRKFPESANPSPEEFLELAVLSESGHPIALEPNSNMRVNENMVYGRLYYLIPALVNNVGGHTPEELFEGECIQLLTDNTIKLYLPTRTGFFDYAEEEGVGLIRFPQWPQEVAITQVMDITVRDEFRNPVSFTLYDNQTIRLHLTRKDGFYDIYLNLKNSNCLINSIENYPYPLPLVRLHIDTVSGFRNREACIPVTVRYMNSITDFTMPFYWHSDSLRFSHLENIHPLLEPVLSEDLSRLDGYDVLSLRPKPGWSDTLIIPNGEVLFEICVTPLVSGPASIPISTMPPGPNGDSLRFEIVDLLADHVVNTGIVQLPDDNRFLWETRPMCSETPGKYDLELTIFGNSPPYTYSFPDGSVPDSIFTDSVILIRSIPFGRRDLILNNRFGSTSAGYIDVSSESLIAGFEVRVDSASIIRPSCGQALGQIPLEVTPSHGDYQYLWIEGNQTYPGPLMTDMPAGMHTFRVTAENRCFIDLPYEMKATSGLSLSWDERDLILCPEEESISLDLQIQTQDYHLRIDEGDILGPSDAILLSRGLHTLSVWDGNCRIDTTLVVSEAGLIRLDPPLPAEVHHPKDHSLNFVITSEGGLTNPQWFFQGDTVSDSFSLDWVPPTDGILTFQGSYLTKCLFMDTVQIILLAEEINRDEFSLPNAFSPNADGHNDIFSIPISETIIGVLQLQIFDRYGGLVYNNPKHGNESETGQEWDGTINGREAPPGVYVVKAVLELANGESEEIIWPIQLIR